MAGSLFKAYLAFEVDLRLSRSIGVRQNPVFVERCGLCLVSICEDLAPRQLDLHNWFCPMLISGFGGGYGA